MISEANLIGWLCLVRYQLAQDNVFDLPKEVREQFLARGWMEIDADPDWDGKRFARLTDSGTAICDLNEAEWAIESQEVRS